MTFDLEKLVNTCDRCPGQHSPDKHLAVKRAASLIGRDFGLPLAAQRSGLPEATLTSWLESDSRFKWLVARARVRALKRDARHARVLIAKTFMALPPKQVDGLWKKPQT
jgi:hypothetical protein